MEFQGHTCADSPCGDWISYRDEKCFTVVDTIVPQSGAGAICSNLKGSFGVINSVEEQDLVYNYLKNRSFSNNVWVGIKRIENSFKSVEGASLKYTKWNVGRPVNQSGVDCVEIDLDLEGRWLDVKCDKKNAVLCEKKQDWSFSKIETILQELRKNYNDKFSSLRTEITELKLNHSSLIEAQKKELDNLKQNPVPIGFIYVQLSGQNDPQTLWPNTHWNNVSPNYSGLFFRAEGGNASSFGTTQQEQTQTLFVKAEYPQKNYQHNVERAITSVYSSTSLFAGGDYGNHASTLNFKHSTDEIRPHNQAIRIWIRIK